VPVGASAELPSVRQHVTLPGALPSTTVSDFFTFTWGTTEPAGTYTIFLALTPVRAFADGQVGPSDVLAADAQTVTFEPFDPGHGSSF
jgi:hypothetical protein